MPTRLPNERELRKPGTMELDSAGDGVAIDETRRLIASNKVEGTAVYNRLGEQIGTVYNFMVDKVSDQVAYVVMSFGGLLGIGESYHPLPWKALTYNTDLGGYVWTSIRTGSKAHRTIGLTRIRSPIPPSARRSTPITGPCRRRDTKSKICG